MKTIKCKICKRKCKNLMSLSKHVVVHDMTSQSYYDKFKRKINEGFCLNCKRPTLFRNFRFGYNKTCSYKCKMTGKLNHRSDVEMSKETRQKISEGNKGEHKIIKCLNCQKEIDIPVKRKRKYCSHSCATSYRNKYEDNPMFNKKSRLKNGRSQRKRLKDKQNHPMYGKYHSIKAREKQSHAAAIRVLTSGKQNIWDHCQFGIFYSIKNKTNIRYDSGFELKFYKMLEQMINITKYKRCDFSIRYKHNDQYRKYIPDLIVSSWCYPDEVVEIKPLCYVKNEINVLKANAARRQVRKRNMSYKIWTEKNLALTNKLLTHRKNY